MDDQLKETLESLWNSLTDEQKAKAAECASLDELIELAGEEKIELPSEVLEGLGGGYLYLPDRDSDLQIIDDKTGEVLEDGYKIYEEARDRAVELGQSSEWIRGAELNYLRKHNKCW